MEEVIEVRLARPEEACLVAVLGTQVWLDTYANLGIDLPSAQYVITQFTTERFQDVIVGDESMILVAFIGGRLIGFAQVTLGAATELCGAVHQAEIHRLYVQETFCGRGVGTRILAEVEAACPFWEVDAVWLSSSVANHRALEFYAKRGFADSGTSYFSLGGELYENRVFIKSIPVTDAI